MSCSDNPERIVIVNVRCLIQRAGQVTADRNPATNTLIHHTLSDSYFHTLEHISSSAGLGRHGNHLCLFSVGWISIPLMSTNDDYLSNEIQHVDA